eukprot:2281382-Alexandrium_andersonii.AAC.1
MSASLVGSEMCIRDRRSPSPVLEEGPLQLAVHLSEDISGVGGACMRGRRPRVGGSQEGVNKR